MNAMEQENLIDPPIDRQNCYSHCLQRWLRAT
jgi:hypothetical protein